MEFSRSNPEQLSGASDTPFIPPLSSERPEVQGEITSPAPPPEESMPPSGDQLPSAGAESTLLTPSDVASEPISTRSEAAESVPQSATAAWQPSVFNSEKTGAPATVWVPQHQPKVQETDQEQGTRTVLLGEEQRTLSAVLLDKALAFNDALDEHNANGHECTMFAYACMTDADVSQLDYREGSGLSLISHVGVATETIDEILENRFLDNMPDGTTLVILARDNLEQVSESERHFLVRADTDSAGEPLYLSKFGHDAVVLSTMQAALTIYPSRAIGLVRGITPEMHDPTTRQTEEH